MGMIIDRTHSKYGKARPWLLWMVIPYAIATILLFSSTIVQPEQNCGAYITYN
jgi:GPH family glycoside/pentoside/hexuronide:cation symporter